MGEIQVPPHWKLMQLGDLGEVYGGGTPSTKISKYWDGDIRWLVPSEVTKHRGIYISETERYITPEGLQKCASKLFPSGTVLMTSRATIGEVVINNFPMATNQGFINICCNKNKTYNEFLTYWIIQNKQIFKDRANGVTFKEISRSNFKTIPIYLPPLPEQKTIAHTLRTIQKAKETRQRELELERERKAALMQYLFTHGTRNEPPKQTKVGEIPNTWKVIKFGQICESSAYGPRFSGNLYNPNGTIATLRTTDIDKDGNINYSTMPFASLELHKFKNHLIEIKDLLITRSGTCGIAAVFESYNSPVIPGAFLIRFRLNEHAEPYFLRYYINSHIGRKRITQLASGAVQKNISGTSLLNWLIPLPTIPDQLKIVGILHTCDRKIQALEKEIALTDELFHAMLEQLMTGKISTQPLTETYV
ncbi:restriction endonuclease subunit S [uncultured Nostoc sp.]|uniref:restriction endonuclease subunit S n=1 Tax=uncultured Nostoc sp. TaxID=340711 RepID=UPI0035CAC812